MESIISAMTAKQWCLNSCLACGRSFLTKNTLSKTCSWRKCTSYVGSEKNVVNRGKPRSVASVLKAISDFWSKKKVQIRSPENIRNGYNTDLVSAGVQLVLNDLSQGFLGLNLFYVAQPVVRLSKTGFDVPSSSFVNLCTESVNISPSEHAELVDGWITCLGSVGVHSSSLSIVFREKHENWGDGQFAVKQSFVLCDGEEIGDANYMEGIPTKNGIVSLSDIGFGCERVTWCAAGYSVPYQFISYPELFIGGSAFLHSLLKTISLLVFCGITPGGGGARGTVRRLIKQAKIESSREMFLYLARKYFGAWDDSFGGIRTIELEKGLRMLEIEFDAEEVSVLRSKYGLDKRVEYTLVEALSVLVYTRSTPWDQLKKDLTK